MSAEDVLQYLEDVMEDEGLHGGQQINTLLEAIAESEDSCVLCRGRYRVVCSHAITSKNV
ncbi:unnamed protein product, partial [marine sediment metagenome]